MLWWLPTHTYNCGIIHNFDQVTDLCIFMGKFPALVIYWLLIGPNIQTACAWAKPWSPPFKLYWHIMIPSNLRSPFMNYQGWMAMSVLTVKLTLQQNLTCNLTNPYNYSGVFSITNDVLQSGESYSIEQNLSIANLKIMKWWNACYQV